MPDCGAAFPLQSNGASGSSILTAGVIMPAGPNPQNCVQLLQRMIGFDTVNRTADGVPFVEEELAEYLESTARCWGLQTSRLAIPEGGFNLLVTRQTDPAAPWLLLDSHLDTVDVAGMTIDPFGGRIAGGKSSGMAPAIPREQGPRCCGP